MLHFHTDQPSLMNVTMMIRMSIAVFLAAAPVGGFAVEARGEMMTLNISNDTYLRESAPDNNIGGHTHVAAGASGTLNRSRGLFLFDLTDVPAGSTVTSATFRLDVVGLPSFNEVDSNFLLHRLLDDWGEGTKTGTNGMPASSGDATWNSSKHQVELWSSAGGDFAATASAMTFVSGIASYVWSGAGLIADIQAMVNDPIQNFGWLLKTESEGTARTARRFGSLEGGSPAELDVVFTPVPEPSGIFLVGIGLSYLFGKRRRCQDRNV